MYEVIDVKQDKTEQGFFNVCFFSLHNGEDLNIFNTFLFFTCM